jgi:hypothetical protein
VVVLSRRGSVSLRSLLLAGGVLGNVPFAVIACVLAALHLATGRPSSVSATWFGTRGAARCVLLGGICGIASATVFWIIAFRGTATQTVSETSGTRAT